MMDMRVAGGLFRTWGHRELVGQGDGETAKRRAQVVGKQPAHVDDGKIETTEQQRQADDGDDAQIAVIALEKSVQAKVPYGATDTIVRWQ